MSDQVVIERRFRGPPDSANGGFACGVLGSRIEGAAEVTLRLPPPLERPLAVSPADDDRIVMLDDETLVAEARSVELEIEVPGPVTFAEAEEGERRFLHYHDHPFPECFVCGPGRASGDGLRTFPGKVAGRDLVAAPWTPHSSMAERNVVPDEIVWAALDCPTSFGGELGRSPATSVLGRLTARLLRPLEVGRPYVVIGWPLEAEGRKWSGGSAIFSDAAELCAFAQGLWIELKP